MIEKLLRGSQQAVEVTNICRNQAKEAVNQANTVKQALEAITESVSEISDMRNQVATSTDKQAAVSEEINRNIVSIDDMSDNIVQRVSNLTKSSVDLTDQSNALNKIIQNFKV